MNLAMLGAAAAAESSTQEGDLSGSGQPQGELEAAEERPFDFVEQFFEASEGPQDETGEGEVSEAFAKQLEVARTIKPGCLHWNVKAKDFPREGKPTAAALRLEVLRRTPEAQPKAWSLEKLCKHLVENGEIQVAAELDKDGSLLHPDSGAANEAIQQQE